MFHYVRAILVVTFGCIIATGAVAQTGMPAETRNAALRYWLAFAEMHDPPTDKSVSDLLEKNRRGGIPYNGNGWRHLGCKSNCDPDISARDKVARLRLGA